MLQAVLFDLDNTLILFDEANFFKQYLSKLSVAFREIMPFEIFSKRLISASQALLNNNGEMSNADFYMRHFAAGFENQRPELWRRFVNFYEHEYDQFQSLVSIPAGIHDVFLKLKTWPLKLVLASNPMFPLNVQLKRLAWAQLGDITFDLVTHIENMTFCKPRLEYYLEICNKIDTPPEACLMVGNDPINDIIVTRLGMQTFLTLDSLEHDDSDLSLSRELRNGTQIEMPTPDFQGRLADLPGVISKLLRTA